MNYGFFNGDADGIISMYLFNWYSGREMNEYYTGIKRDVELLRHAKDIESSNLFVFDVSMLSNEKYLKPLIDQDNTIRWYDHHKLPDDENIRNSILYKVSTDPKHCTAMMVEEYFSSSTMIAGLRSWVICAAYGDNLHTTVQELNEDMHPSFTQPTLDIYKEVGETLNYNGYGNQESDLTVHPKEVFLDMCKYDNPKTYHAESEIFKKINTQMKQDASLLESSSETVHESEIGSIIILPEGSASIRYSGIYSNLLSMNNKSKAFAIMTVYDENNYKISIRAPQDNPVGACDLALKFPTGGGREKAAGVNQLPCDQVDAFVEEFVKNFTS